MVVVCDSAIAESRSGKIKPQTIEELKQELGVSGEETEAAGK
jgi:antitoxin YefM